jgi:hypothetical protein
MFFACAARALKNRDLFGFEYVHSKGVELWQGKQVRQDTDLNYTLATCGYRQVRFSQHPGLLLGSWCAPGPGLPWISVGVDSILRSPKTLRFDSWLKTRKVRTRKTRFSFLLRCLQCWCCQVSTLSPKPLKWHLHGMVHLGKQAFQQPSIYKPLIQRKIPVSLSYIYMYIVCTVENKNSMHIQVADLVATGDASCQPSGACSPAPWQVRWAAWNTRTWLWSWDCIDFSLLLNVYECL